jgi:pyrroline-5-carboxylate reductase
VKTMRVAILGTGSMGSAILAGMIASDFDATKISVSTKSASSANRLNHDHGVKAIALEINAEANREVVEDADVVLVATKPAYVVEVLKEVSSNIKAGALVISVAAGITTSAMEAALPESVAVIRSMPNTPAIVGRALTGLAKGSRATDAQVKIAEELFGTVGRTLLLNENRIDALGTISGSGPAYVFYLVEQLTVAAVHQGFSDAEAKLLVNETFLGAIELLVESGKEPQELRRQVTSPNGTTMQAIARIEQADLATVFAEATDAALKRSHEIAAGK